MNKTVCFFFSIFTCVGTVVAVPFIHPGGLHTLVDLQRMRTNVLAGNHPWIDDWQRLVKDPEAQTNWRADVQNNIGGSRQRADQDAHAAYLNTLRWYISGDTNYAECAVRICNAWSSSVTHAPVWSDTPGLSGIPIFNFALAGEMLRGYPGWKTDDFNRYTNMMIRYFYPQCHGFLSNHNGACISYYWANWDACNIGALIAMGVLCDNTNIFNEGVEYFKHGAGMGSISNAVPFLYSTNFGQWQESGRDQEHAQLGIGLLGSACQVAWNQGVDLFGYADNRLLAGAEYVAKCNLSYPASAIPYTFYDNCANARQFYLSPNQRGRIDDRPVWELIYNHYAVLKGLPAPYVKAMVQLVRPERGSGDHFGYGTLTFTLNASASPYPPNSIPPVPVGLKAEAGISQVFLNWEKSDTDTAQGYVVFRSTSSNGPFTKIAAWSDRTSTEFSDHSVSNGSTYYYVIAARNQAGVSKMSPPVSARPAAAGPLPAGWTNADVGAIGSAGDATFAAVSGNTFIAKGAGGNIGGKSDAFNFTHRIMSGDFVFTARLLDSKWSGRDKVGLMVRDSLAPGAKAVALTVGDLGNRQCRFGTRAKNSTPMTRQAGDDYTISPVWFRIQRKRNWFTAFQSVDSTNWFKVGASQISLTNQCYIGLAIAAGKKDIDNTSVFDHILVQPAPTQ
ncbi:MAG TPA: alginate lyase family protein [Verrucomicrobiae bacterium]|nr:alginate lyase family protein [Verrucomicrobiae bacterium]